MMKFLNEGGQAQLEYILLLIMVLVMIISVLLLLSRSYFTGGFNT